MTKARTLGNFVSTGNPLSDGTIAAAEVTGLATVATSGSYNDLSNKPTITTTATNIAGGSNGTIPYQSAADTTQMLAAGTSGYFLKSNGVAAPSWDAVPATTPAGSSGQLQYNNAGAFAAVSSGTSGQLLTSAGSGAVPTWTAPSSGALTLLSTVTASNSATVDVETTFSSTYDAYLLVVTGMTSQNNNVGIRAQMKLSGSYVSTSTYKYFVDSSQSNFGIGNSNSNSDTEIRLSAGSTGNNAADSADLQISIYNPSNTAFSKMITWDGVNYITSLNTGTVGTASGIAVNTGTGALTGLRIYFSSGNVVAGKFRLYGISNS